MQEHTSPPMRELAELGKMFSEVFKDLSDAHYTRQLVRVWATLTPYEKNAWIEQVRKEKREREAKGE